MKTELLYTAVTRAKTICVLAGNRCVIGMAVRNNKVARRFTALERRLGETHPHFSVQSKSSAILKGVSF